MTKPPDLEALARRYVELWQDQLAATAADPEIADAVARAMQAMGNGAMNSAMLWQAMWSAVLGGTDWRRAPSSPTAPDAGPDDQGVTRPAPAASAPPAGPAAAAAAPDGREFDLAQLTARLAVLEERLAALEPKPQRPSGRPASGSRRRRTP